MRSASEVRFVHKLRHWLKLDALPASVRRWLVAIIGGTILLIGLALILLPGPAFVVIPAGLAILATEFVWARRYLQQAGKWLKKARKNFRSRRNPDRSQK